MTLAQLFEASGRFIATVTVTDPPPPSVNYHGRVFVWCPERQRYEPEWSFFSRENTMPQVSQAHQQLLSAAGIDVSKLDFTKILALVQAILALFATPSPAPTPTPSVQAVDHRAALKAAGCPDDCCDAACACMEAAGLALAAAETNLDFVSGCCPNG